MARVCIICNKEFPKGGYIVPDDMIIKSIRKIKQTLNMAKNNELMVCEECVPAHRKKRAAFEKNVAMYLVFSAIVFLVLVIVPILSGNFSFATIIVGLALCIFLVLLSVLGSYSPRAEGLPPEEKVSDKKAEKKDEKKEESKAEKKEEEKKAEKHEKPRK
jgi:Ca2+/Na+ antiporter